MRSAADYFGLIAYMFVMYGGLPGSDSLWSEMSQPAPATRGRPNLRVIEGNPDAPKRRRRSAKIVTQEMAA
jgi:hypothetical protein